MKFIYNILNYLFQALLPVVGLLSPKMKLFVAGRKNTNKLLRTTDFYEHEWLWFHCASLGEYEQAVPLITRLKSDEVKILVSFFSPSGYEQKKNHELIDLAIYLAVDTPENARLLVQKVKPKQAFFIKYEFWENYFEALNTAKIPIYMVSSTFRKNQVFFKWYGVFFKNTLKRVTYFFVQNKDSEQVLLANGFSNVMVSGDTRYDRVSAQLQMDNQLSLIQTFKGNRVCVVLGSTWSDCESFFAPAINNSAEEVCFIIAPHEIKKEKIHALESKLNVISSIYSKGLVTGAKVLIIDSIGLLTRIYSYADIAYVGGAVGTTGLHNVLEPAVFGIPILVGPNVSKFPEATALKEAGGLQILSSVKDFEEALIRLVEEKQHRDRIGLLTEKFVHSQLGATEKIVSFLRDKQLVKQ